MIIISVLVAASAFGSNPINPGVSLFAFMLGFFELVGWHALVKGFIDAKKVKSVKSMIVPFKVAQSEAEKEKAE